MSDACLRVGPLEPKSWIDAMRARTRLGVNVKPLGNDRIPEGRRGVDLPAGFGLVAHVAPSALLGLDVAVKHDHWRWVAGMTALSRRALGREGSVEAMPGHSADSLAEELRDNILKLPPPGDLPAFLMVHRAFWIEGPGVPATTDPARALALASRIAGSVYLARRSPGTAALLASTAGIYLYAPRAGTGVRP